MGQKRDVSTHPNGNLGTPGRMVEPDARVDVTTYLQAAVSFFEVVLWNTTTGKTTSIWRQSFSEPCKVARSASRLTYTGATRGKRLVLRQGGVGKLTVSKVACFVLCRRLKPPFD